MIAANESSSHHSSSLHAVETQLGQPFGAHQHPVSGQCQFDLLGDFLPTFQLFQLN